MILSIIIVAYNNGPELDACLDSIYNFNDLGSDLEVIVVDNSKNDSVEKRVSRYTRILYIRNPENGFGRGNNIGFKASKGQFLFFLNPDTEILSFCFKDIVSLYSQNEKNGIAGVRLINADGKENNSYNVCFNFGFIKKILLHVSRKCGWFLSSLMYTSGADIFIERELFEGIGGFDNNIFMYGEEEDLSIRVRNTGKRIVFFPSITIKHLQGQSTEKGQLVKRKRITESLQYICEKHKLPFRSFIKKELRYLYFDKVFRKVFYFPQKYDNAIIEYYESLIGNR